MFPNLIAEVEELYPYSVTTGTAIPEFDWGEVEKQLSAYGYHLILQKELILKDNSDYAFVSNGTHTSSSYNEDMDIDIKLNNVLRASADHERQTSHWTKEALQAFDSMAKMCSAEQLHQLETVLNIFFTNLSGDLFSLVEKFPLDIDLNEDDFISVDWTFKNLSIGFTLESDRRFSGWWASSNAKAGNLLLAGLIPDDDKVDARIKFCLRLVIDNIKGLMA